MMSYLRVFLAALCLLAVISAATSSSSQSEALAKQDSIDRSSQWEYTTASVAPATLDATLNKLGGDRWEVFSIERDVLAFEQDQEKTTHLVTEKYRITARRERR